MIYLLFTLYYILGAILMYALIQIEDFDIGEQVAWIVFWPFVVGISVLCSTGSWIYEKITGNKVRF